MNARDLSLSTLVRVVLATTGLAVSDENLDPVLALVALGLVTTSVAAGSDTHVARATSRGRSRVDVWEIDLAAFDRHGSSVSRSALERLATAGLVVEAETVLGLRWRVTPLGRKLLSESHYHVGCERSEGGAA